MMLRRLYLTDAEHRVCLDWLRDKMMNQPEAEGELLLEILETNTEALAPPLASAKAPVIHLADRRTA